MHTLTFNVIFNGTEEIQMDLIQDTISNQADHFNVENKDMMFIGQQLVYLGGGLENFPINISDYLIQNYVQTTESPGINLSFINEIVHLSLSTCCSSQIVFFKTLSKTSKALAFNEDLSFINGVVHLKIFNDVHLRIY